MVEQGFPGQLTVTNTTATTYIHYDPGYIKTIPGILKVAEILLNFLGFICIITNVFSYTSRGSFFNSVSMTGFWFTGIMLIFYLFHIIEKFNRIPWLKIELIFCSIIALLYLIAASLAVSFMDEAFKAAGFFGYCAMLCYAYDAYLKLRAIQSGAIPQGQHVASKQTSSAVISPVY